MDATIYHNPKCSTSRKALQKLREHGVEPTIVKYLDEPFTRTQLEKLFAAAGLTPSQAVRKREALYKELDLASASDEQILDAMVAHPILVERPFVVTDKGTRLTRPMENLDEIL
ncbi:arsenate reductase [Gordonia bronchialis DSM 43247]|uniref:arsenate reductase (glutathione/glutaredoxin) n=1 Tax=Gordonia bronchialis (strain ATCC 25592 / DSM 43247 / BCRC 13721 / JCM 3198 / KCTC 3076 / NBRC 16047 / NCTC 10667) TaxID=526226 RepID=D0L732_GORB4|nr:arsenate reductase (glutaredoxin) [Gordonia bronchialis]ACY20817.1 arsenate reductase [Gordonia bronchialis DSM 43247]MCC3323589.1 arsenate reductase (glutaredoxin) [Gordonia bronchialis]QGS25442.1 arsenate reductase (glutaredoxin) [Gordonia bronchialis]UAK38130.1 arsenate reductase (glutaredoxin) [Gordonia bronchialis]STQ63653.1 Arsenate reductase [Gordonia bronchialis]